MKELQKHEIELNRIKNYVDQHTGYDISTRSRKAEVVLFRALYFKLACDTTNWSLQKIGKIVNRDHATVLHAKKYLFDELMENKYLINLYEIYRVEILGQQVTSYYKDAEQYNRLKEKYNNLLALKIPNNLGYELTVNETAYRNLSAEDKKVYDERAKLVLKSFEWKRKDDQREEVYDIIIGEPTVNDARASLR